MPEIYVPPVLDGVEADVRIAMYDAFRFASPHVKEDPGLFACEFMRWLRRRASDTVYVPTYAVRPI